MPKLHTVASPEAKKHPWPQQLADVCSVGPTVPEAEFLGACCQVKESRCDTRHGENDDSCETTKQLVRDGAQTIDGVLHSREIGLFLDSPNDDDCIDVHGFDESQHCMPNQLCVAEKATKRLHPKPFNETEAHRTKRRIVAPDMSHCGDLLTNVMVSVPRGHTRHMTIVN